MMKMTVTLLLFLLLVTLLYGSFLSNTPVHLNQDELGFAINAYSVSQSSFDENGRFFPLYFWHLGVMWATPIIVYLTTLFLKFLPLSETAIRLPAVLVGLTNITLIYFLAKKLFQNPKLGFVTAFLLAITPAHFIHSRILLDNLFIVPFVLSWLLLLLLFLETKNLKLLFFATFLLGIGIHSYHAAKIMMPLYLLFTLIIIFQKAMNKKIILIPIIAFVLPLLPLIPWLSQYPDTLTDQVRYTNLYDSRLSPIQGLATLLNIEIISQRIQIWISYFNPEFLFLKGDASLIHSTQKAGVFLLPFIILLPIGLLFLSKSKNPLRWLIFLGFITSPIAAAFVGSQDRISKALVMLPFAIIIATYGIKLLLDQKNKFWKFLAVGLIAAMILQFSYFVNDYFNKYRIRSYNWFNYNIPNALEKVITEDTKVSVDVIYLDNRIYFIDRYWKFYLIKNKKEELFTKTSFYNPLFQDFNFIPNNSLILSRFDHFSRLQKSHAKTVEEILEPDGFTSFYIYRR